MRVTFRAVSILSAHAFCVYLIVHCFRVLYLLGPNDSCVLANERKRNPTNEIRYPKFETIQPLQIYYRRASFIFSRIAKHLLLLLRLGLKTKLVELACVTGFWKKYFFYQREREREQWTRMRDRFSRNARKSVLIRKLCNPPHAKVTWLLGISKNAFPPLPLYIQVTPLSVSCSSNWIGRLNRLVSIASSMTLIAYRTVW